MTWERLYEQTVRAALECLKRRHECDEDEAAELLWLTLYETFVHDVEDDIYEEFRFDIEDVDVIDADD
ncbi:MAG: hypothetical protein C4294_17205 [Nitrospiraceae bacterium]